MKRTDNVPQMSGIINKYRNILHAKSALRKDVHQQLTYLCHKPQQQLTRCFFLWYCYKKYQSENGKTSNQLMKKNLRTTRKAPEPLELFFIASIFNGQIQMNPKSEGTEK